MKLKHTIVLSTLCAGALHADMLGGEISAGIFSHDAEGTASYRSAISLDAQENLYWKDEQDITLKAYFEHPLPFIPNIKVAYSDLSHEGRGEVYGFSWGDIVNVSGDLDNALTLRAYDLTLYYEILDNVVEADAGITLRYLDGSMDVRVQPFAPLPVQATYEAIDFDAVVPMLYAKGRFHIPTTDISLQFEGNFFNYDETTFYDYEISARYTFAMGVGIEAGYRTVHLDSTELEDDLLIDVDFKGPYAALVWDF